MDRTMRDTLERDLCVRARREQVLRELLPPAFVRQRPGIRRAGSVFNNDPSSREPPEKYSTRV